MKQSQYLTIQPPHSAVRERRFKLRRRLIACTRWSVKRRYLHLRHLMKRNGRNSTSIMHAELCLVCLNLTTSRSFHVITGRRWGGAVGRERGVNHAPPCKGYLRYTDPGGTPWHLAPHHPHPPHRHLRLPLHPPHPHPFYR